MPRRLIMQLCLMLLVLGALAFRDQSDGKLHLIFPVLPGDATIVRLPDGQTLLLDGGSDPAALTAALGRQMPFWQRSLVAHMLTCSDSACLPAAVAVAQRYRVGMAAAPLPTKPGAYWRAWTDLLHEQQTRVVPIRPGQPLVFGAVRLRLLADGGGAAVWRVEYGRTSVVLAGMADAELERLITPQSTSLLVWPWQRDPRVMVERLHPSALLLSDGLQAEQPVAMSLPERGVAQVYHEAVHGALEWVSDGQLWFIRQP